MKRLVMLSVLLVAAAAVAGCSGDSGAVQATPAGAVPVVSAQEVEETKAPAAPRGAALDETLVDEQGAVSVAVTPLAVSDERATLDFEVALNTHSVDLSMDLAALATLTTDTGAEVTASSWDAPVGGHHATGMLSFPVVSAGGRLLDGATTLTLTLQDVDAPARTFTWSLK
jgi:hypothetical protein